MNNSAKSTPPSPQPGLAPRTEADLLALPEEGRGFELIDGALIEKEGGTHHGRAQVQLSRQIGAFDRRKGKDGEPGGWWIFTEQLVRFAPHTLRPDVAGWRRERLPRQPKLGGDGVLDLRPDWVCEIISPRKAAQDLVKKRRIYHQHQVPFYWIIDPRDETLTVNQWGPTGYTTILVAERSDVVRAEPFPERELVVAELFDDDDDEDAAGDPG